MKTINILLLAFFSVNCWANHMHTFDISHLTANNNSYEQDTANIVLSDSKIIIIDNDSTVNVTVVENEKTAVETKKSYENTNVEVIEGESSTRIIVHKDGDTVQHYEMNFKDLEEVKFTNKKTENNCNSCTTDGNSKEKSFSFSKKKNKRFKGHWSGFEMGLNNYLTDDFKQIPDETYMEIHTGKSWNFNLNFAQFSIPVVRDKVGIVSGLGLEWSNYHFANQNTIVKDPETNVIVEKDLSEFALKKNRLQTTYLTAPLLLEAQLGSSSSRDKRVAISGGIIAGLKLGSHTKFKTSDGKVKNKDDFYLQSFRYGYTGRIHYGSVGLYFNYYQNPLFIKGKGPELYPYAAGLVLSFN